MIPENQAFGKNFTKQAYWLHHQICSRARDSQTGDGQIPDPWNIAFWIKEYSVLSIIKIDAFLLKHYPEDWKHLLPYRLPKNANAYIDDQESVQILDPHLVNVEDEEAKVLDQYEHFLKE